MSRRSLHLGLNSLDRDHYRIPDDVDGVLRTLHAAEHDAVSLHQLMESTWDFDAHVLLGQQVTAAPLTAHVAAVAAESTAGDTFLLSFSGHGVQWSKSPDPDETDGYDESWALYDRLFFDDEIFDMCRAFPAGVRIVLVADSCHSQTSFSIIEDPRYRTGRARGLSREAAELTIEGNLAEYDRVRQNMNRTRLKDLSGRRRPARGLPGRAARIRRRRQWPLYRRTSRAARHPPLPGQLPGPDGGGRLADRRADPAGLLSPGQRFAVRECARLTIVDFLEHMY